jgi:deazaflavin-dependent oxidoreductase (nitroreductase family)
MSAWLAAYADQSVCYLTTVGRRSGHPHRIEIWFATTGGPLYLLAGGRERADWVRNLTADAHVLVELAGEVRRGQGRVIAAGTPEDQLARELVLAKYTARGNANLADWSRDSLAVAVDLGD